MMKTRLTVILFLTIILTAGAQNQDKVASTPALNYDWKPGLVIITEATGGLGLGNTETDYSRAYAGFNGVASYQFSRNIMAGGGLGLQFHNGGMLMPLFFDTRLSLSAQELVPFIGASAGLALDFANIVNDTRVFINPSIGIRYVAARKTGVTFSTGMMILTAGPYQRTSFINFKLGLQLKVL